MLCKRRQHGFSLPIAIFILVIMSLIAAAAVSIMQSGMTGVSNEVLSTRAFYAAESGAQAAMNQLFPLNGAAANCPANYSSINHSSTGLANCTSSAQCSSQTIASKTYYTITSTGVCSAGDLAATRQVQVLAATP